MSVAARSPNPAIRGSPAPGHCRFHSFQGSAEAAPAVNINAGAHAAMHKNFIVPLLL
jgi:hypothetical protein